MPQAKKSQYFNVDDNDNLQQEGFTWQRLSSDTLVHTGTAMIHSVTFSTNDAAPTAGSIILYDSINEAGNELLDVNFTTTWFAPTTVILDAVVTNGLYVGFTTTADVNVTVTYRTNP